MVHTQLSTIHRYTLFLTVNEIVNGNEPVGGGNGMEDPAMEGVLEKRPDEHAKGEQCSGVGNGAGRVEAVEAGGAQVEAQGNDRKPQRRDKPPVGVREKLHKVGREEANCAIGRHNGCVHPCVVFFA